MARVVSWRVNFGSTQRFAYITDANGNAPLIENEQLDQSTANRIGSIVLGWNQSKYVTEFNKMQQQLDLALGEHVDLGTANKFWNITEYEEGGLKQVLMLVGADGKNTSEELSSYYTFHLVNQAIAIGTGEDWKLDKDADIEMEAFFMDRNGNKYSCNGGIQVDDPNFQVMSQDHGSESTIFTLRVKNGTMFVSDTRSVECVIFGTRQGGGEGKAVFTVTAVLGGKEGVSYDLIVAPKQFHFSSPQEVAASTGKVNVGVLMNGKTLNKAQMDAEGLTIGYEYDVNGQNGFYDEEDITPATVDANGKFQISPLSIYNNSGTVAFYLLCNGNVVDSDSASVVVDGEDGLGTVTIELDNEVEAIGVGDDNDLDLPNGVSVTASTNVRMYSGETSLIIEDIDVIDATVNAGKGTYWDEYPIVDDSMIDGNGDFYGTIRIVLKNGFEFGDDLRDKITLNVTGRHPGSSTLTVTKTCAFTILGVKGGEDGVIFRLTPSCDYIMYDPNAGLIQCEASEPFPVSEVGGKTISATASEGSMAKSPAAIEADGEKVTYTVGVTYSSAQQAYNATSPGVNGVRYTAPLSEVLGDMTNPTSRYITFYWTKKIGVEFYLIDRETVPVISAGLDGKFAKIELGNEVDAITIGDDTKLDIGELETVEVGTSIRAVGGDLTDLDITTVRAEVIQDFDGWHSDSENWPAVQLEVSDDNGTNWRTADGNPHKKWRFFYNLPNGFDFGEDKKEKIKLDVTYKLEDGTEHTGSAIFTIVGVPGGKEGQRYQLVPEVDIVRYFANDDRFDEEQLQCDATIGLERLETGHIYYGERVKIEQGYRVLDIISPTFKNEYVESNSVQVRDMYFGQNPNFSGPTNQIAWYLTIDTDEGELIVDHETVSIVADGKDGDPNISVELSNEIESISTGTDTSLGDMDNGQYVSARTDVYVLRGNEKIEVCGFAYEWLDNVESSWIRDGKPKLYKRDVKFVSDDNEEVVKNTNGVWVYKRQPEERYYGEVHEVLTTYGGEIGPNNRSKYTTLEVLLNKNFDFGKDMRKRLILILSYRDAITEEVKSVRGLFTLIGIKGGKDGMTYRLVPTPDYVLYDFETQSFPGGASVAVKAYNGATLLSDLNIPYEIYYSKDVVYDMESIPSSVVQVNGGVVTDAFGTPAKGIEQRITFYLKVDGQWVDRETVPLITNGKEGKDGAGSFRFDLVNPLEVLNTGDDNVLNVSSPKTYTCVAYGYSGTTASPISVQVSGAESKCSISTGNTNDGGVQINVTLSNGFAFNTSTMKKEISITATSERDTSLVGNLKFVLVAVMNGSDGSDGADAEGDAYRLRTNVSSVVYDGSEVTPERISAAVYLGSTLQKCDIFFYYWEGEEDAQQLGLSSIMNKGTYTNCPKITYSSSSSSIGSLPIFGSGGIITSEPSSNGTIYIAAFNGNDILDYDDIPVTLANLGGGSSGILADLTDDVGVVATGEDKKLEAGATLKTKLTVRNGFDPIQITAIKIENNTFPYTYNATNGGKIVFSKGTTPANEVEITATITASESNYIDFTDNNPLQFNITITAKTAEEEEVYASTGYSILGLKGGKDGWTVNLTLNSDQIFYDANMPAGSRFTPSQIKAKIFVNGEDYTSKPGISFDVKNSDMQDPASTELWIPMSVNPSGGYGTFNITETSTSEFQPLTIRAKSGTTVIDWETVQVYRNGKDGAGGLMADVTPASVFVQTTAGHPTVEKDYSALVSLWTGSTQDGIQSVSLSGVSLTSSYKAIGGSSSGISAKVENVQGEGMSKYKRMLVKVTTSVDLSNPIAMLVAVQSSTEQSQTRYASFTLDPNQGGKGDKGPKTRMRDWAADTDYLNGEGGDEFWDYVYYDGSYYGCLEDHRSTSSEPPSASCYNYGDEPVSGKKWVKYSGATFTASRIAFFGDGSSGWTIDTKKIEHTTKSITLNGDTAAMEIRNVSPIYRYKKSGGSTAVYTNLDLTSAEIFAQYAGNPVPVYEDVALTTEAEGSYILTGSRNNPQLVKTSLINIPVTVVGLGSNNYLRAFLSSELGFDLTATFNYDVFTTTGFKTWYSDNSVGYSTSIRQYTYTNNSVIPAGDKNGSASPSQDGTSGRTSSAASSYDFPSSFWQTEFGYSPYTGALSAKNSVNFENSEGGEIRMGVRAMQYEEDCKEEFKPIIDEDDCRFETYLCSPECSSESVIYPVSSETKSDKFVRINSITFSGYPNGYYPYYNGHTVSNMQDAVDFSDGTVDGVITPASVSTEVYSNPETINPQDNESLPLTAVINGNVKNGSEYGDIVIAAGIDGTEKMVQAWTSSGEDPIFTIGDPPTGGTPFTIYVGAEMPFEATATRVTNNISYNGHSYSKSGNMVSTNATKFAKSRIYKDGSIITSRLFASDGSFNGVINADRGNFTGGLNASNCNVTNARIEDSFFRGTMIAPMGGSITVEYNANTPMLVAAPIDVTEGYVLYAVPSFSHQDNGSWLGLGTKTNTNVDYWLMTGITASNGSTVKIPSFSVTVSGKKIKSCVIKLVFTGIQNIGSSGTVTLYNDPNGNKDTGGSGSFYGGTYTANGSSISIKIVYSFSIGGGSGKISMSGKFGGQVEIGKLMTTPYYAFGSNGIYLTDGYYGTISMTRNNGLSIRYKGSKTNELFMDYNKMLLSTVSGGYKYSLNMSDFIMAVENGASPTLMAQYITKTSI